MKTYRVEITKDGGLPAGRAWRHLSEAKLEKLLSDLRILSEMIAYRVICEQNECLVETGLL